MSRSDTALVTAASAGDRTAFAALIARTAPDVAAHLPTNSDPHDGLRAVYTAAMRELFDGATPTDVDGWLYELAKTCRLRANKRRQTAGQTGTLDHDLDRLWGDLAPLWPRGRKPYVRLSRRAQILAVTVLLLLGALYAVIEIQIPRVEADTLIATVYQPEDEDQPALETPPTDSGTITVPVIPLPPISNDQPRIPQPSLPATDDDGTAEPNNSDANDQPSGEPLEEPSEEPLKEPSEEPSEQPATEEPQDLTT